MIDQSAGFPEVARSALGYLGLLHGPDGVLACVIGHATHTDAIRALEGHQRRLSATSTSGGISTSRAPQKKSTDHREEQTFRVDPPGHADLQERMDLQSNDLKSKLMERLIRREQGERDDFLDLSLPLNDRTQFQRLVLACCRAIPWGETRTYGQLAREAGSPGAARAVGQVMATNRLPLIVPCHRVVSANGGLGGFSAPSGIDLKRRLLQHEQQQSGR
jgi:O-6-methylguanine DNA methyltransferase